LISLVQRAEADRPPALQVAASIKRRAIPDYFISHVDVTRIRKYRVHTGELTGEPSSRLPVRYLSE
jgi:hypothetical protein